MLIEALLAALAASTAVGSLAGWIMQRAAKRKEVRIASDLKSRAVLEVSSDSDPRDVNAYLVRAAGPLSVREYATDSRVREVVGRVVSRVDDLLEGFELPAQAPTGRAHLVAARKALERGDAIGALARMRLAVELELRQVAEMSDLPPGGPGVTRVVHQLQRRGLIRAEEARVLTGAIRLANGGLHGEDITLEAASEAVENCEIVLGAVQEQIRNRFPRLS